MKITVFLSAIIIFLTSCTKQNEVEDIFNKNNQLCDTTNVGFSNQISKIFNQRCVSCHHQNIQPPDLDTYEHTMAYILNPPENSSFLYYKITEGNHEGIVLNDCEKNQLRIWLNKPLP
jgi:alpha-acetolactate decarboxylase